MGEEELFELRGAEHVGGPGRSTSARCGTKATPIVPRRRVWSATPVRTQRTQTRW